MNGAVAGLVLLAVLVILAIIILSKSVALIPQAEAAVIERLGRYSRTVSGQLTLDGTTGHIYAGAVPVITQRPDAWLAELAGWRREVAAAG